MNDRRVDSFIDAILNDEAPTGFAATPAEQEVLRVAIALSACQPRSAEPDSRYVEDLARELADQHAQHETERHTRAGRSMRASVEVPDRSEGQRSRARRIARRRVPFLAAAAAAVALAAGSALTATMLEPVSHAHLAQQGASAQQLRSAELVGSGGRDIGRAYAYGDNPSWVFMSVRSSGLSGTYSCELLLLDGTTVRVGAVVVHNGSGVFAHPASVNANQLRAAMLVSATGSVVARASIA